MYRPSMINPASFRPSARLVEPVTARRAWYDIRNMADGGVEVLIYDEISPYGVTAKDFIRDLGDVRADNITVRLNTPGGEVFDGMAIYDAIKRHRAHVTTVVDGLAASIGSVIMMAGDHIVVNRSSTVMIHDGHSATAGNAADLRKLADLLDKTSDTIAQVYADRTGSPLATWRKRMRAETWYNAFEAVEAGLADEVGGDGGVRNEAPVEPIMNQVPEPKTETFNWDPEIFRSAFKEAASD